MRLLDVRQVTHAAEQKHFRLATTIAQGAFEQQRVVDGHDLVDIAVQNERATRNGLQTGSGGNERFSILAENKTAENTK